MYEAFSEERGHFGLGQKRRLAGRITTEHPLHCMVGDSSVSLSLYEDDVLIITSRGRPLRANFLADFRRNQYAETRIIGTEDPEIATIRDEILLTPENHSTPRLRLRNTERVAYKEAAEKAIEVWFKFLEKTGKELVI